MNINYWLTRSMLLLAIVGGQRFAGIGGVKAYTTVGIGHGVRMMLITLGLIFCSLATNPAHALQGATGIHDPSTIIKRNGIYHVYGTGSGISHLTSTDLVR